MGMSKGQKTKRAIELAARAIAVDKGFSGASQREIAQRAGVDKPLVQYHFPEKRLFAIGFMEEMLDLIDGFANDAGWLEGKYFENLLVVGGMNFAYLIESRKLANITPDLLSQRESTEAIIGLEIAWATKYLNYVEEHGGKERWEDLVVLIMGGAYELIYRKTAAGEALDAEWLIKTCIRAEMGLLGFDEEETADVLASYREADYDKAALFEFLDKRLFQGEDQRP